MSNQMSEMLTVKKGARLYQFIGAAILILCSFSGWAGTSCYLLKNTQYTFPSYTTTQNVVSSTGDTQLGGEVILEDNPSAFASDCKQTGNDTDLVAGLTIETAVVATVGGVPVLRTSVPGIGYAVGIRCINRNSDGCDNYKNQTVWMGSNLYWPTHSSWYPYDTAQTMYWRVVLRFYQLSNYKFNGDQSAANNKDAYKTMGILQIGSSSQPTSTINLGWFTINLHGTFPTCVTTSSQDGNSIDLGDYTAADLRNNVSPKKVPFNIVFSKCSNVATITTKLTSNYVTSGTTLLGNRKGDLGAGVEISTSTNSVLLPNNTNSSYSNMDSSKPDSRITTFFATLKDNGQNAITPGSFETGGTLTFTYE